MMTKEVITIDDLIINKRVSWNKIQWKINRFGHIVIRHCATGQTLYLQNDYDIKEFRKGRRNRGYINNSKDYEGFFDPPDEILARYKYYGDTSEEWYLD